MDTTEVQSRSSGLSELTPSETAHPTASPRRVPVPPGSLPATNRPFAELPIGTLFGQLFDQMNELVRKEVDLARAEIRSNVADGMRMIKWFSIAAVCAASGITLLLMTIVLALAEKIPGWAAALILAGVLLACGLIAGLIAWNRRIRSFLAATQRSLKGNMQWKHEI